MLVKHSYGKPQCSKRSSYKRSPGRPRPHLDLHQHQCRRPKHGQRRSPNPRTERSFAEGPLLPPNSGDDGGKLGHYRASMGLDIRAPKTIYRK